jgi:hypothetical protein
MLPAGFLAALKIGAEVLAETATAALELKEALRDAMAIGPAQGIFSRFRREVGTALLKELGVSPSEAYRVAKYWLSPGPYLRSYAAGAVIDPLMARVQERKPSQYDELSRYNYVFSIRLGGAPGEKPSYTYKIYSSERQLSRAEAESRLRELLIRKGDKYEEIMAAMRGEAPGESIFTLIDFFQNTLEMPT